VKEKHAISVTLEGVMFTHVMERIRELGLRHCSDYLRKLVADDIDDCADRLRPKIVYYGSSESHISSDISVPSIAGSRKPVESISIMTTNSEVKGLIKKATKATEDGNMVFDYRKLLKRPSKAELKRWKDSPTVVRNPSPREKL
jgi:hypothetical protein